LALGLFRVFPVFLPKIKKCLVSRQPESGSLFADHTMFQLATGIAQGVIFFYFVVFAARLKSCLDADGLFIELFWSLHGSDLVDRVLWEDSVVPSEDPEAGQDQQDGGDGHDLVGQIFILEGTLGFTGGSGHGNGCGLGSGLHREPAFLCPAHRGTKTGRNWFSHFHRRLTA
jgi:hypothetical protein